MTPLERACIRLANVTGADPRIGMAGFSANESASVVGIIVSSLGCADKLMDFGHALRHVLELTAVLDPVPQEDKTGG